MFEFAAAVFLLIITPGPGVLTTAGVGSAFGRKAGFAYISGLFVGTNLVCLAVVTGLAAIVLSLPWLRNLLLCVCALYLLYLAMKIALAGSKIGFMEAERQPGLVDGILLQLINPKAYAVNSTLMLGFAFWPASPLGEVAMKLLVMNAIWIPIHVAWLFLGIKIKEMNLPPKVQRRINLFMALALVLVVGLAIWSLF